MNLLSFKLIKSIVFVFVTLKSKVFVILEIIFSFEWKEKDLSSPILKDSIYFPIFYDKKTFQNQA